jgi:hypothetical protein
VSGSAERPWLEIPSPPPRHEDPEKFNPDPGDPNEVWRDPEEERVVIIQL